MKRIITGAFILLLVQIGIIVFSNSQKNTFAPYSPDEMLVEMDSKAVDRVIVEKGDETSLEMVKKGDDWVLVKNDAVALKKGQLETVLDTLAGSKKGLAVATSAEAADRFQVGKENFTFHLICNQGDATVADVYLGTSAGYKKSHVRVAGSDDIVTLPLGEADLSTDVAHWLDRDMLGIDLEKITALTFGDTHISRGEDTGWIVNLTEGEGDSTKVDPLVEKIASLRVSGLVDGEEPAAEEPFDFTVSLGEKDSVKYSMIKVDDTITILKRSDLAYAVEISTWQLEEIETALAAVEGKAEQTDDSVLLQESPPAVPAENTGIPFMQ